MKFIKFNKRSLWLIAAVAALAFGSAWWSVNRAKTGGANFETARRSDLTVEVSNDPHFFKIARMTPEGARVEAGQMVMELDTQEINQKLREYQAELGKNEEELIRRRLEYDAQMRDLRVALEEARVKLETTRHKLDSANRPAIMRSSCKSPI
jgi:multidrug resistance efflux pump